MREIADFAHLVRRARETSRPDAGFAQWCATAKRARNDGRREVAALVAGLREAPQRALLIAVSMLQGARQSIAELLGYSAKQPPQKAVGPKPERDHAVLASLPTADGPTL